MPRKLRSRGLKQRTAPPAPPQKMTLSDSDRDWAAPVCTRQQEVHRPPITRQGSGHGRFHGFTQDEPVVEVIVVSVVVEVVVLVVVVVVVVAVAEVVAVVIVVIVVIVVAVRVVLVVIVVIE